MLSLTGAGGRPFGPVKGSRTRLKSPSNLGTTNPAIRWLGGDGLPKSADIAAGGPSSAILVLGHDWLGEE
jgi:hypothetical protein